MEHDRDMYSATLFEVASVESTVLKYYRDRVEKVNRKTGSIDVQMIVAVLQIGNNTQIRSKMYCRAGVNRTKTCISFRVVSGGMME